MDATLLLSSLAASVASGLFLAAGLNVQARKVSPESRRAVDLFCLWWLGLSLYAVAGASHDMVAAMGVRPAALFIALRYVQMVALCIGLWGLMYYVAYVLTGRRSLLLPLSAFYVTYYAGLLYVVTSGLVQEVRSEAWRASLVDGARSLPALALALLLAIPPLVGAAMLLLCLRVPSSPQRVRVLLVAGSTVAWSAGMLAREAAWVSLLPALLGLLSAWSISWAYQPPVWLRERLEARSLA